MTKDKPKPSRVLGCCERGDHAITPRKPSVKQPTEPCPVCHNDVGEATPDGIIETWAILPCGHRFGDYCLKVWLGMSKDAKCPICRKKMMHACGHPTLPRTTMPPVPQPNNVQAEDIGHSENPAHGDEQEIAGVHEVPGVQEENEAMAIDQVSMEAFHGSVNSDSPQASSITQATSSRMSPKKAVRVAAQRVRSIRKAVRSSFVDESESEPLNDVVAGPSGSGPAQAANSGGPILAAIAQQPPRPGLIQGPLNATPSPRGLGDRRRQRRRKFRLRASLAPHTAAPAPAGAVPPADGSPLARVSSQTVILGMLASQSHTQPANTPYFFKMAYPKEVDLSLPCAYCYLTMYHEPEDSPYRGGNGSVAGVGNAFSGNAQAIARSANTIKAAAMLAIRFFFKNLTPGSNFLTKIGYSSGDSGIGQTVLSQPETVLLAAYWDSWRQVNGKAFGQWWAEQEPRTEPAVEAAAEGWDLANLVW